MVYLIVRHTPPHFHRISLFPSGCLYLFTINNTWCCVLSPPRCNRQLLMCTSNRTLCGNLTVWTWSSLLASFCLSLFCYCYCPASFLGSFVGGCRTSDAGMRTFRVEGVCCRLTRNVLLFMPISGTFGFSRLLFCLTPCIRHK